MGGPPGFMGAGPVRAANAKETLKRLWQYLRRQKAGLIAVFLLTAFSSGMSLIGPYLIGMAVDWYILPQDYYGLLWLCVTLFAVYALGAFLSWVQAYVMVRVSQRTVWEMRNDLFAKLQKLPLRFYDSKTHGELMSRTTNDIENVANTLNQSVAQVISSILTVIGALAIMLALDVWLTLLCLVTIPLMTVVTRVIARRTRKFFSEQQKSLGELNGFIEETISGQKVVTAYCREETAVSEFSQMNTKLAKVGLKAQIFTGTMGPVMNLMNNLSFAVVAIGGGWLALAGVTTVGIAVSFINYSRILGRPINELANQFNMIQAAIAGAERVFEIMDTETEYEDVSDEAEIRPIEGEVVFDNVSFEYKAGVPVLKQVSFTAKPGETIALVGPTGSGKTTIVNLLTRFYDVQQGTITIDGTDIRKLDKNGLRRKLGIVLQDAYVFSGTIRENIRYGKLDATDEEVEEAARLANADPFIRKLPQGYETKLAAEGSNLSHGQRQLITIARAILANPSILVLDEATSSIDTRTEMHIQEAMKTLMRDRTSFVIAHRLSTIREADQILVIHRGEIIERGTHDELLAQKGFYYNLYMNQFERAVS
jgi:ATP-binding cassette subfamily B protein